jgi:hypothetical protein
VAYPWAGRVIEWDWVSAGDAVYAPARSIAIAIHAFASYQLIEA